MEKRRRKKVNSMARIIVRIADFESGRTPVLNAILGLNCMPLSVFVSWRVSAPEVVLVAARRSRCATSWVL